MLMLSIFNKILYIMLTFYFFKVIHIHNTFHTKNMYCYTKIYIIFIIYNITYQNKSSFTTQKA